MPAENHNAVVNFLGLCPQALREGEVQASGKMDVLVPRFGDHALGRWLQRQVRKPFHRIHLDEIGTHVWKRLDGQTSVHAIAQSLQSEFGERIEPVVDRLESFLGQLARARLIRMNVKEKGKSS